jgi:NADPH2:quinone reductase
LVHAAAGSTGNLLTQVLKLRGAKVVATVSSAAKAAAAHSAGADSVVVLEDSGFERAVWELSEGVGADVVYDSVGAPTFTADLNVIRPGGAILLFGQTGGAVPPIGPGSLPPNVKFSRPSMPSFLDSRGKLLNAAAELFDLIRCGLLRVQVAGVYPLQYVALTHARLESRLVIGKQLLDPSRL